MTGQHVGYVRVSTLDQNTARQLDGIAFELAGNHLQISAAIDQEAQLDGIALDRVFIDKASGKDTNRPQLAAALDYVREGDTFIVHSMDRLARSLPDLRRMVEDLTTKGVAVRFVKENLTFERNGATPFSTLMLNMLGAIAEFERGLMLERQREGIAIAKAKGVYKGRKPALTLHQQREIAARIGSGESPTALAREFGVARATIYNTRNQQDDVS